MFSTLGVFSTSARYHEYIRGYSACMGECLVCQGNTMSTSGDIMSKLGDVQYIGDTMSTLGDCSVNQRDIMIHVRSKVPPPRIHVCQEIWYTVTLTLFDMGFFCTVSHVGGGHEGPHHNFVVIALMNMKFGTGVKLDVFYTMVTKKL